MNNPDNNRCALLNRLDRIKDHPFQHNIVQIDEEVHVQTDISFIECDNVDGTCDSDNDGFYDINAVTVCWKNSGYKWELQTSEGDGFHHIDGDDRIVLGKISLVDDDTKNIGYILNDGGVIFKSNQSLDYDVFNTIIVRSYAIRANFIDIDKIPSMKRFTFNKEDIISSEDIECLSAGIEESLRCWAKFDEDLNELETEKAVFNSYINETWKIMDNPYRGKSFIKYIDDYKIHLQYFESANIGRITIHDKEYDLYRAFSIGFKDGFRNEVNNILWFFEKFMLPYVVRPSEETQDAMNKAFNKLPYHTDIICMDNDIRKGDFRWKE